VKIYPGPLYYKDVEERIETARLVERLTGHEKNKKHADTKMDGMRKRWQARRMALNECVREAGAARMRKSLLGEHNFLKALRILAALKKMPGCNSAYYVQASAQRL
jgi:hypothetical protein